MAVVANETEFVNRTQELEFLAALLPPASRKSSLVVLRSPPGFGKSRLTMELINRLSGAELTIAIVDPLIRAKPGETKVYDGVFLQRCAEQLSKSVSVGKRAFPSFDEFLSARRWRNVTQKSAAEELRRFPTLALGYSLAVEYGERFFSLGRYAPKRLLSGDSREAVAVCSEYVEFACKAAATLLVIRETQHIDHESLRGLLQAHSGAANQHLIFEYTTESGRFEPDHEKIFQRELHDGDNVSLIDLAMLDHGHLEYLLKRLAPGNIAVSSDFYANWKGDLRVLGELRYRVSFARRLERAVDIGLAATDLRAQMRDHIDELAASQRWLLAILAANVEPLHERTLVDVALDGAPNLVRSALREDIQSLSARDGFVVLTGDQVSLAHDDLAATIKNAPSIAGLLALGEKALRDHYVKILREKDFAFVSLSAATRRAFVLCARTRETTILVHLIDEIDVEIKGANDQTIYVDVVASAVEENADLLDSERARLVDWAGSLAYEINDFLGAIRIFDQAGQVHDVLENAMIAFSSIELGAHERAATIAQQLRAGRHDEEVGLVADLIDAVAALDRGDWTICRKLLEEVVNRGKLQSSALVGHALRLLPEITDYPHCTDLALESVAWFESLGLRKCRAYSALSASRFLARTGRFEEAVAIVEGAGAALTGEVRNQHLLLNNRALVGMLAPTPDYDVCAEWLRQAVRFSRDDFSDLTILSNLAVTHWKRGASAEALEGVSRCIRILDDPGFVERDVFWPVCFNLGQVLDAHGQAAAAAEMRKRPREIGWGVRSNEAYWAYRYGDVATPDVQLAYLYRFDYHPTALSHWQIDFEALARLKRESRG